MATVNETRLQAYLDAEAKILRAQSVRSGAGAQSEVRRAELAEVRAEITRLQRLVAQERSAASGRRSGISQADLGGEW